MAAKKYYFGVGGGTRRFLSVVEKDGELVLMIYMHIYFILYNICFILIRLIQFYNNHVS